MSQEPATVSGAAREGSASGPEKRASEARVPAPKLRSCAVCRSRKVRCDKRSPCSNCLRANIACVVPSADRHPRWARRLDRLNRAASNPPPSQEAGAVAEEVMGRLHNLEGLVKELRGQLEQANSAARSAAGASSATNSPGGSTHDQESAGQVNNASSTPSSKTQKEVGRLVLRDAGRSRYVDSSFWSRVNDELDRLKMNAQSLPHGDSNTSDDETPSTKTPSTQELGRTPSARHAFLFRHNLSPATPDLCDLHPLPSQIPFLLDVFGENVNVFAQVVHLPTVKKMVRDLRSNVASLTPANEALMFAIYYVAITSMEEDDVLLNFGSTKTELNLKYRLGLEYALAKADFLNVPDLVLVQGFIIFLLLVRRHDSPRFVWMMTGLAIRMGQALGLHRDGSNFVHLTPFEVEMRRRVWWALCMLDVRAAEDQGSEFTIARGSFDTKMPLNINDADISPDSKQMPQERGGLTDMSFSRVWMGVCDVTKQMIAYNIQDQPPSLEEQSRLLNEIYQGLEKGFLQYSTESGNIAYWVSVTVARLVMAKLSLLIYLPVLFSSPSEQLSKELRTKLLVSAIEAAEYNHALNAEKACRHWRWLFQTYTHWYAVVYILLEISRRPWSPLVERAWVALHSTWLIPNQSNLEKNLRIWFPLRKLMAKARKHRETEIERLRSNQLVAEELVSEEHNIQQPLSSGPYATASDATYYFLELWCNLLGRISGSGGLAGASEQSATNIPHSMPSLPYVGAGGSQPGHNPSRTSSTEFCAAVTTCPPNLLVPNRTLPTTNNSSFAGPRYQPDDQASGPGLVPWLWADEDPSVGMPADVAADVDFNMDLDGDVDWYNWVDSAKGI